MHSLYRQAQPAQRLADRLPDLGAAGMGPDKAGDREPGLQFEPPLGRDIGLLDATELGKGCGAQKIRQAEARIGLFGFAAGRDRRLPIAGSALSDTETYVRQIDRPVERAPAQRTFGVVDRLSRPSGMAEDHGSQA